MDFSTSNVAVLKDNPFLTLCVILVLTVLYRTINQRKLPPGPRPLPLIGNLHQLGDNLPDTLLAWHRQYGPIISYKLGQQRAISIGSHEISVDLLNKRGAIYSSRPDFVNARHSTHGLNMALMPHTKQWETHRRLIAPLVNTQKSNEYRVLQDVESKQLLSDLMTNDDFSYHFMRYTASLGYTMQYGKRLEGEENKFEILETSAIVKELVDALTQIGFGIVELFPVLDFLPSFLAPWKKFGEKSYNRAATFYQANLEKGQSSSNWNWTQQIAQLPAAQSVPAPDLSFLLGLTLQAGVETTVSALRVFIKASLLHPECVKKAQKELDEVVGPNRLPNFEDSPRLPYIHAMVEEILRWQQVAPIGIPHATTADDEYMGYHIPKDTAVIPNNWAIAFDETTYPDPYAFKPERWLDQSTPAMSPFGYGRRICPGKQIALNTMYINAARILWGYDIRHVYRDGKKVEVDAWDIDHSFVSGPKKFEVDFQVRSERHREVIEKEWMSVEKDTDVLLQGLRGR